MKLIPLGKTGINKGKFFAMVDDEDFDRVSGIDWYLGGGGYIVSTHKGYHPRKIRLHRVIMRALSGQNIDHINGNKLDNRKENLRICEQKWNSKNRGMNSNNTSGYKGVSFHKPTQKWMAYIKHNYKFINLGLYLTKEKAAKAYNRAAKRYHGEFARLNQW